MQDRVDVPKLDEKYKDMDFSSITMRFNYEQNFLYIKRGECARKFISENKNLCPPLKKKKKKKHFSRNTHMEVKRNPSTTTLADITEDAFEKMMAQIKLHWIGTPSGWEIYENFHRNEFYNRLVFDHLGDFPPEFVDAE